MTHSGNQKQALSSPTPDLEQGINPSPPHFDWEHNLKLIVAGIASKIGEEFFQACARYLAEVLQIKYALIAEFIQCNPPKAEVLAFWSGESFEPNFEYDLRGTPCGLVCERGLIIYPHSIQQLFPEDEDLVTLQVESYLGIAIVDSKGQNIGHIAGLHTEPLKYSYEQQESILKIFAARSAAEIERQLAQKELERQNIYLQETLKTLKKTQAQLIHVEKMSSLGQMVAGVAHEINNPVTFISGNISHIDNYFQDLLDLVHLFQDYSPNLSEKVEDKIEEIELDYIEEDLPKILNSMSEGTKRIGNIVKSLRTFSRLDEAEMKSVDIHAGIDSVLMILKSRLKSKNYQIEVLKSYENLPDIYCYASALNQVFINILSNAIDAVKLKFYQQKRTEEQPTIWIKTEQLENDWIRIEISDNGSGMTAENCAKIFEPFFTTKPVGQGTGLGLSTSYQIIVEQHQGRINCISAPDKGAKFVIEIPMK